MGCFTWGVFCLVGCSAGGVLPGGEFCQWGCEVRQSLTAVALRL